MEDWAKSLGYYDGIGPVKIGMTLTELNSVLHEEPSLTDDKDNEGCFYVEPKKFANASFMIIDGRLARIDIQEAGIKTVTGIIVGDTEAHAFAGVRCESEDHPSHLHGWPLLNSEIKNGKIRHTI